jgi:predicted secreted protein
MAAEPQKKYPRGFIAMGNGDLIQVTNIKVDHKNNAKQVHTIRKKGAGIVMGVEETSVSFDAVVDENGSERDYLKMLKMGEIKQLRIKVPGETISVNGVVSDLSKELPLDSEIKFSITFIGHAESPTTGLS